MNRAMANIAAVCQSAVREHAKGNDATDAEIEAGMERSVPGTVTAALNACASKSWKPVVVKSRASELAKKRAGLRAKELPAPKK